MMRVTRNLLVLVCAAILMGGVKVHGEVSLELLLKEMVDYDAVARWPQPEFNCKQASSYDRASVAPDQPGWFANNDQNQFMREEQNQGRTEKVMMDANGPGCIVRFWLTTDQNKQGVIRIYLDGASAPAISFPAYDLLSGNLKIGSPLNEAHPGYRPDANGGNNFYLPIPYAKHCKVTWEEKSRGARYYQINYRTYAPGTKVQTFTRRAMEAARPLIARVNEMLQAPPDAFAGKTIGSQAEIPAGGGLRLKLPGGSHAVRRFELTVPPAASERALRSLIVQMVCDGEINIWCPATDFFGSGVGLNPVRSWYRSVSTNGTMTCRWVMPYQHAAEMTLTNLNTEPISVGVEATVGAWKWDDRSMHFYSAWHFEAEMLVPPPRDWNYVRLAGRGVYVGDTLALFNPNPAWYGEGDEKIWVDGESFPSHFGTGTEDYYGYSYAPKPAHQGPFCGEPRIDQPQTQGNNTSIRSRNLDGIPFHKSLQFDIELLPWRHGALTCAATTYWYGFPGITSNRQPQPGAATLAVPTLAEAIAANVPKHWPGAVECEKLKVLAKSGDFPVREQNMEPFGARRWSGGSQLLAVPKEVGDFVEIEVPVSDNAPRQFMLYATQAPDYGQLRFSINGRPAPVVFDGYASTVLPAQVINLGAFTPHDGVFTMRVEVVGANPAARGAKYQFGLDCLVLNKL